MSKRSDQRYRDRLFAAFGEAVLCPICESRPCHKKCPIGFTKEDELVRLSNRLRHLDVVESPHKRKRGRR